MLRAEEKLRQVLEPAHIQLLSQISKLQGGVKDIVDMRNDLLVSLIPTSFLKLMCSINRS